MFRKAPTVTVYFEHRTEGYSSQTTAIELKDNQLYEHFKYLRNRYGNLVISFLDDNVIHVHTKQTDEYDKIESYGDEVKEIICNFIAEKAVPAEAFVVLEKGTLRGVFHNETLARLKRGQLLREDIKEEDIVIAPITIGSFQNFSEKVEHKHE